MNIGRTRLRVSLGELSSHAEREPIWNDLKVLFLYKLFRDCAPNEANYVCTSQLSDLLTLKVYQYKEICITYTLKKCSHSPTEACKTILFIKIFRINIPKNSVFSEHRQGVRKHTTLGELPSHAECEPIWNDLKVFFLYKLGRDCAPNAANCVCPADACKTTIYNKFGLEILFYK